MDSQQHFYEKMQLFKKVNGSGITTLIISNKQTKIVKSLEESILLVKKSSEIIKNETKEQKGGFLPMILGKLFAGLLGRALKGVIRAGQDF